MYITEQTCFATMRPVTFSGYNSPLGEAKWAIDPVALEAEGSFTLKFSIIQLVRKAI